MCAFIRSVKMANDLLIIGAGQFGIMVSEIAGETGLFDKIDFLDDKNSLAIGKTDEYSRFVKSYPYAICAIGNPQVREKITAGLTEAGYRVPNIISPHAYVSPSATLGYGVIVEPMAVIQKCAKIGNGVIVSSGAVVRHDGTVGNMCHLDCNSVVMSMSSVPAGTKVACLTQFKNE